MASPAKRARMDGEGAAASAGAGAGAGGSSSLPAGPVPASDLKSWVSYDADCDFSIQNLPFGVFKPSAAAAPRPGIPIGDQVIDLSVLADKGFFDASYADTLKETTLNAFMGLTRVQWSDARKRVQALLLADEGRLRDDAELRAACMVPLSSIETCLPCSIGDYTDFYSSREHATNVGLMWRGIDNALQPNWKHLPVGYHGRASSVVNTGTPIRRPCGQLQVDKVDPTKGSTFGPCRLFDFELEIGVFVGTGNKLGDRIDITEADNHIFGLVLMNDWSARDIQKWEYVPLGPFTGKNMGTTISPWIVTLDALEPFTAPTSYKEQVDPEPLPYLKDPKYSSYDINLSVGLKSDTFEETTISKANFRNMYWNARQQLVHHTVTGCNMRPGDLLGSGTISATVGEDGLGEGVAAYGSMLELSWKGTRAVTMPDGSERKFLKDGDNVVMRGHAQGDGFRVGFGTCEGVVTPAVPYEAKK